NQAIAEIADRVITVRNGKVDKNMHQPKPKSIDEVHW
ncbi:MAG TPA: ABC transporter ATP-binding protein, partial [Acholeplasmataceae bacterium]|nr:ABC transporter ATP-binding protein [Acholeplasmataceae bacterium]